MKKCEFLGFGGGFFLRLAMYIYIFIYVFIRTILDDRQSVILWYICTFIHNIAFSTNNRDIIIYALIWFGTDNNVVIGNDLIRKLNAFTHHKLQQ